MAHYWYLSYQGIFGINWQSGLQKWTKRTECNYDCNYEVYRDIIWYSLLYPYMHLLFYGNYGRILDDVGLDCNLRFNHWILVVVILLIILGLFGLELLSIIITLCIRKWGVYGKG